MLEEHGSSDTQTALDYIDIDTIWSENLCFFHIIFQTKFSTKLADMHIA